MSPFYLIGVDGGGSGTRARLTTCDGRVLGHGEAGPSGLSQGVGQAWRHVGEAVDAAFCAAGLPAAPPGRCAIGLGLAGAGLDERRAAFLREAPPYAVLAVDTDGHA